MGKQARFRRDYAQERHVLEIGHGGAPFGWDFKRFIEKLPPDAIYHGIDLPIHRSYYHPLFPSLTEL